MFYCKENLYAEFEVATQKDTKGKKEKYDNRIQFFKDHIELRKNHPEYYKWFSEKEFTIENKRIIRIDK